MKLVLFNGKEDQVTKEIDLGKLSEKECCLVWNIIDFLEQENVLDRYKDLMLTENYRVVYNEGESEIIWD